MATQTPRRNRERMTVSLSPETRHYISTEAAARGTDQSAVVEDAVRRMFREERKRVSQAALLADAEVDEALAEAWMVGDTTLDDLPWEG